MPILVVCTACGVTLKAPDAAAGNRVKCRNCQSLVPVPLVAEVLSDFDYVDPATVAPVKPVAAKPIVASAMPAKAKAKTVEPVEEDENPTPRKIKKKKAIVEDDDEDEAPRKSKKGKKATKKTNPMILVLGGVGALLAVGFLSVMVWYVAIRDKTSTAATNTIPTGNPSVPTVNEPLPGGWTLHEKPEFTVAMLSDLPQPPTYQHVTGQGNAVMMSTSTAGDKTGMGVFVTKFDAERYRAAIADPERIFDELEKDDTAQILERRKVVSDGFTGREILYEEKGKFIISRIFLAHGCSYLFAVYSGSRIVAVEHARICFGSIKMKASPNFGSGVGPAPPLPTGWTRYDKPEFSIALMLGTSQPPTYRHIKGNTDTVVMATMNSDGNTGMVVYVVKLSVEEYRKATADQERTFDELEKRDNIPILERKKVTSDGCTGREIFYEQKGKFTFFRRFFAHGCSYNFMVYTDNRSVVKDLAQICFDTIKMKPSANFGSGDESTETPKPSIPDPPVGPTGGINANSLVPTDLTPYGYPATIDLPKGTKIEREVSDIVMKAGRSDGFYIRFKVPLEPLAATKNRYVQNGATLLKDQAEAWQVRAGAVFTGTTYMRRDIAVGNTVIAALADDILQKDSAYVDAMWKAILSLRQSEAQKATVRKRDAFVAKLKAKDNRIDDDPIRGLWMKLDVEELSAELMGDLIAMGKVNDLTLAGDDVADKTALLRIGELANLERITISGKWISDEFYAKLGACKALQVLYLGKTPISATALAKLKQALPKLKIDRD